MSIAPIVRAVETKAPLERAFALFTGRMHDWWPKGKTIAKAHHVEVVIEPCVGGRWYERDAEGNETHWGDVLEWTPPHRVLLAWRINSQWTYDPAFLTEVEVTFEPIESGGTRVTLEHRKLEAFGSDAAAHAAALNGGWPTMLQSFADLGDAEA